MAEIINLRRERKTRARQDADQRAAENRALHGRTKGERLRQAREAEQASQTLDGHKRETDLP